MAGAAALAFAAAAALLLAAWRDPRRLAWALLTIAGAILYFALRELPHLASSGRLPGQGNVAVFCDKRTDCVPDNLEMVFPGARGSVYEFERF